MTSCKATSILLSVIFFFFVISVSVTAALDIDYQITKPMGLFDSDEHLELRLEGDINALMKDRGEDPSYHVMKLHYKERDSITGSLDLRVRVRGNFRRLKENCKKPPLKFNFKKHAVPDGTPFTGQSELKLVVPCVDEEYVLREFLTYKLYNLFTDHSFRVRLIRLTYHDTQKNKTSDPEYGFLIEDEDDMASRNQATSYKRNNLRPETIDPEAFFRMSVFAYMIGNTDWSIQFRHNIKLIFLEKEKVFVAVPYDFDLVGLVSSPYAKPAEELKLRSVRERVYRGYCLEDLSKLDPIFEQFREFKPEIYKIYTEAELLEKDYVESTIKYFDEFYKTINNPEERSKAFSYPCNKYGTGNVVIKGMNER